MILNRVLVVRVWQYGGGRTRQGTRHRHFRLGAGECRKFHQICRRIGTIQGTSVPDRHVRDEYVLIDDYSNMSLRSLLTLPLRY
jgi:hypothetical protein